MSESDDDAPSEAEVTAEFPDSVIRTTGTDHVTLVGSNEADTVAFYRDTLGMRLVMRQPNLDDPSATHLFFDSGDGRVVTFFVSDDRDSHEGPQRPGIGAVHHLAFSLDPDEFEATKDRLREADHRFSEFDRGAFHSLYTRDHNGLVVELVVDKYEIPDDRRGEVLSTAQRLRVEAGAEFVDGDHLEAALEELGLPVEPNDLPDAAVGSAKDWRGESGPEHEGDA
ncbi:VOC family protein [Halobium salinum]|uniref:VOC family protein n=1 Tax=Halobium salinum TaxID=1364940 RepID=A0ABD5P6F5_9EURY|nr:VOC family protein [Halobium salinum]